MSLSYTEENYLKAIYKLVEKKTKKVSTNGIAKLMETSAASVTDMLKRLAEKEMIIYQKYQGVKLTEAGKEKATELVRKHRLWEVFLVKKLKFEWDEVHEIAEELEHISSIALVERLDEFLDHPKFDPHGDPIPNAEGKFTLRHQAPLSHHQLGQKVIVLGVKDNNKEFLQYLNHLSISIGTEILIEHINTFDQSMEVMIDQKNRKLMTHEVCQKLLVNEV